jgi:CheY-like chemotaxis protein
MSLMFSSAGRLSPAGHYRSRDAHEIRAASAPVRILVVDDEEPARLITKRMLEYQGYAVSDAASAREALARIQERGNFAAAVIDIVMPEMDGLALAEKIQALTPACRLLLMTGYTGAQASWNEHPPVFPVLRKPFTTDQLTLQMQLLLKGQ